MNQYDEKSIQPLSLVEHVRKRPRMYIYSIEQQGLHQLVFLALMNIFDETVSGSIPKQINVILLDDSHISIQDNGEGISINPSFDGVPMVESWLTSGSQRFSELLPINALSDHTKVEIRRDGYLWRQEFARGLKTTELTQLRPLAAGESTGTTVTFKPDFTILDQNEVDYEVIAYCLNELAALRAGLTTSIHDERSTFPKREDRFFYENGLAGFVEYLNRDHQTLHSVVSAQAMFDVANSIEKFPVEIAFQYINLSTSKHVGYANDLLTEHDGTDQQGFIAALLHSLNNSIEASENLLQISDITSGLTSVISVHHPWIMFNNSMRRVIVNDDIGESLFDLTVFAIARFAEQHPDQMQRIIEKCLANKRTREGYK